MRFKRMAALVLALALLMALPSAGLAAKKPTIKLPVKMGLMFVGDTARLTPKLTGVQKSDVTFSSSDEDVATISEFGVVQATAEGRSVLTVSGGGVEARCGLVVLPKKVILDVGETLALPSGGVERYRAKDEDIAEISDSGTIFANKAGNTLVAVKYGKQVLVVEVVVTGIDDEDEHDGSYYGERDDYDGSYYGENDDYDPDAQTDSKVAKLSAAKSAEQIVLVEYTGGSKATLSFHEKYNGIWVERLTTSAYVGKNGIGKTKEGDKKTPTGTYNLTTPFGIKDDPGAKMPYTKVTKYHYWCGASSSKYYNQLVDSRVTGREYTSSDEHLIDYKGVYNYCMFIDYNADGTPHKGSCIFLHCKGSNAYTAGCVAIDEGSMKQIIQWARPGTKIVIQKA